MVTFSIPKMKCGGCAETITKALQKVDEAASVTVDLANKEVAFDSGASQQEALIALTAAGYPATVTR